MKNPSKPPPASNSLMNQPPSTVFCRMDALRRLTYQDARADVALVAVGSSVGAHWAFNYNTAISLNLTPPPPMCPPSFDYTGTSEGTHLLIQTVGGGEPIDVWNEDALGQHDEVDARQREFLAYIESISEQNVSDVKRIAGELWQELVKQTSGNGPVYRAGSTGDTTLLELEFEDRELLIDIDSSGSLDCLLVEDDRELYEGPVAVTKISDLARWLAQGGPLPCGLS